MTLRQIHTRNMVTEEIETAENPKYWFDKLVAVRREMIFEQAPVHQISAITRLVERYRAIFFPNKKRRRK